MSSSRGSLNGYIPIRFITYANPVPVSGSANAKDPPAPGVPNAVLDDPNTHLDVGLLKPSEYKVSALPRKSRAPPVGITAGAFSASNTSVVKPNSAPPVAATPYSLASDRAVPV